MLAPFLALALTIPPNLGTGASLYSDCKAYIAMLDNKASDPDSLFAAGHCIGYISGFSRGARDGMGICGENAATVGTIVRVYLAYMDKKLTLLDKPQDVGLLMALQDAYPCPK